MGRGRRYLLQVLGNYQVLEEILTAKSKKSKKSKKEEKRGPENKNLFDFFFLIERVAVFFAVNLPFKVRCFSGNVDVEKVNADVLIISNARILRTDFQW
jgi:hypothetical protein